MDTVRWIILSCNNYPTCYPKCGLAGSLDYFTFQLSTINPKRPSLNSLNTLLKRFSYGWLAKSVSAREREESKPLDGHPSMGT